MSGFEAQKGWVNAMFGGNQLDTATVFLMPNMTACRRYHRVLIVSSTGL
jgi:hypothetical protein